MDTVLDSEVAEAIRRQVEANPENAQVKAWALFHQLKRREDLASDAKRTAEKYRRLAKRHHIRAGYVRAQFEEFKRNLEALGIEVIIEESRPNFTNATLGGTSERSYREAAA